MNFYALNYFLLVLCAHIDTINLDSIEKLNLGHLNLFENPKCEKLFSTFECTSQHEEELKKIERELCGNENCALSLQDNRIKIAKCCGSWNAIKCICKKIDHSEIPEECSQIKEICKEGPERWSTMEIKELLKGYCSDYRIDSALCTQSPQSLHPLIQWTILVFVLMLIASLVYFFWPNISKLIRRRVDTLEYQQARQFEDDDV